MRKTALPIRPLLVLGAVALTAFLPFPPVAAHGAPALAVRAATVDHAAFDRLLRRHVSKAGLVSYRGFRADEAELNRYLALLSQNPPATGWSKAEQMAYWINAYNAYTIRLILDHYPLRSIRDIVPPAQTPAAKTPWQSRFFRIGGQEMSLDHIEHDRLRKQFNDPRIHFALVCASISCPRLRNEAYTADKLDRQLDQAGRAFLTDPTKNQPGRGQLSRYFDWYKDDWALNGQSVAQWVHKYAATRLSPTAKVQYLDYDWRLNEQR